MKRLMVGYRGQRRAHSSGPGVADRRRDRRAHEHGPRGQPRGSEVDSAAGNRSIAGDPNGRGEVYVFGIDGDPNTLCYVLTVDKIAPATAAHIHEGAAGSNGPVVVNLARPADGNSADCLTEGEQLASGPAFAPGTTVQEILANPDEYYVNVHNA